MRTKKRNRLTAIPLCGIRCLGMGGVPVVWSTPLGRLVGALAAALVCAAGATSATVNEAGSRGQVSLRWSALSNSNSLSPQYQDLLGRLRLSTAPLTARGLRLHLGASARQGLDELFAREGVGLGAVADSVGRRDRYESRRQVRHLYVEAGDVGGGQLLVGRHRSPLRALGLTDADGLSWTRDTAAWTTTLTGGFGVAFWQPDAGFDGSAPQAGAEVRFHPSPRWSASAAAATDEAWNGERRWRLAAESALRPREGLRLSGRAEVDPADGRWLLGRLAATCRPARRWMVRLDLAERRAALFPVGDLADSSLYGGRSRDVGLYLRGSWGRGHSAGLRLRSRYGDRQYRSEALYLRWARFLRAGWSLSLRASHSWSPWRRLERASAEWRARWGRYWHTAAGLHGTLFRWEASRAAEWRARVRPRLAVRYAPNRAWSWECEVEETVDEFQNLRARASSQVTFRW